MSDLCDQIIESSVDRLGVEIIRREIPAKAKQSLSKICQLAISTARTIKCE
jgi:hypothetical protein